MTENKQKFFLTTVFLTVILLIVIVWWWPNKTDVVIVEPEIITEATSTPATTNALPISESTLGTSVEGRAIKAYTIGEGERHLLFVGGIHGGYEWNSVLLAYEMLDHLAASPDLVADDSKITIIPALNPDGLFDVVAKEGRFLATDVLATDLGVGRFNANNVDLNRNFDCKWQPESTWRGNVVSAGTAPFSEPEAAALRDYVLATMPDGVVFWHSQANAVYASECESGILPDTRILMDTYASASGYTPVDIFDAYPVTGDAEGWLASIGIPAVTVELATHTSIDWQKNLAGVTALLTTYGK